MRAFAQRVSGQVTIFTAYIGKNGDSARLRNIFLLLAIPKQCKVPPPPSVFLVAGTRSYFSIRDTSYGIRASIDRFRRQDEMNREVKITDGKAS